MESLENEPELKVPKFSKKVVRFAENGGKVLPRISIELG